MEEIVMDNILISILLIIVGLFIGSFIVMLINKLKINNAKNKIKQINNRERTTRNNQINSTSC